MELTWYGRTCIRLRGKDAVVVNDPYPSIVGPTGRGITGDVVTFSHPDDAHPPKKARSSRATAGRRCPRASSRRSCSTARASTRSTTSCSPACGPTATTTKGAQRGRQTAFVIELDGVHTIHLGDIGHELTEEKLADIGRVDVACVPIGGALTATKAAALIAQLDPKIVIPMPVCEDEAACDDAVKLFLHEMGAEPMTQPKLSIMPSSLPAETTTVLLESRGKV